MADDKRLNVVLIVADDLGYSDVGCYGGEIHTPHIDRIAREGMLFTDYFDVAALPEILSDGGYYNVLSGKWHLGFKPECGPHARGFHRSLSLLPGQTNHWAYHPELDKPNRFFARMPILHTEQGKRKIFPTNTANDYSNGFYSSDCYADTLIRYLDERSPRERAKPFFAMLPFAAPHWPLQCSKEDRDKYKGMYDDGPSALRERRVARLKELGLVDKDVVPHEMIGQSSPGKHYVQWEEMTPEQRAKSARAMETYAGMVEAMDRNVGKVLDYLERIGEMENTLVAFMSDNGSEGAAIEAWPVLGDDILRIARLFFNNKLENIGNHDSFVWYGPRWAQASTAPSKLYKGYSTEGGIRVPFVMRCPRRLGWPRGQVIRGFSTVMDIAPTILDLAGLEHPVRPGAHKGTFRGRSVYGMRGKSWVPAFYQPGGFPEGIDAFHGGDSFVGWELHGRAALRKGNWKITYLPSKAFGRDRWELYDMTTDPGERIDLSEQYPDKHRELLAHWKQYVAETGTVWDESWEETTSTASPPKRRPVSREEFGPVPWDTVGGDPVEQCTAWMDVGEGEVARETPPSYKLLFSGACPWENGI